LLQNPHRPTLTTALSKTSAVVLATAAGREALVSLIREIMALEAEAQGQIARATAAM